MIFFVVKKWPTNWFPVESNKIDIKWAKEHCHDKTNNQQLQTIASQIKRDYDMCSRLIKRALSTMYVEAAQLVNLTIQDRFAESPRLIDNVNEIRYAFQQDTSFDNFRKMAFVLYFYKSEIYQRIFTKRINSLWKT